MGFHRVARQRHLPSLHMLYCLNSLCEEERHKCDGYISVQHTVLLALYAMLSFVAYMVFKVYLRQVVS